MKILRYKSYSDRAEFQVKTQFPVKYSAIKFPSTPVFFDLPSTGTVPENLTVDHHENLVIQWPNPPLYPMISQKNMVG